MAISRIVTDIPPGEDENFVIALIRADGGSFERQLQPDGKVTIVATFDSPAPAPQLPSAGTTEARWMEIARAELESNVVERRIGTWRAAERTCRVLRRQRGRQGSSSRRESGE